MRLYRFKINIIMNIFIRTVAEKQILLDFERGNCIIINPYQTKFFYLINKLGMHLK